MMKKIFFLFCMLFFGYITAYSATVKIVEIEVSDDDVAAGETVDVLVRVTYVCTRNERFDQTLPDPSIDISVFYDKNLVFTDPFVSGLGAMPITKTVKCFGKGHKQIKSAWIPLGSFTPFPTGGGGAREYYIKVNGKRSGKVKIKNNAPVVPPAARVSTSATASVDLIKSNTSCETCCDGSIHVVGGNGVGPYTYQWSDGSTSRYLTDVCPGDYEVTISDAEGYISSLSGTISPSDPTEVTCGSTETDTYDDAIAYQIVATDQIRLTEGFAVKGDFFRAYIIDDCPCDEEITGCCQLENSCVPSVSECWCYEQDGWLDFIKDGECGNSGCEESCTDKDPTTTVCCLTDNGCQEMTEQACCEAGYEPADSEACVVNGNIECSVITCGHCYRCEVIDGVNQIEAIAPYNQAECGADPNYTWSPNVVCVGEVCPDCDNKDYTLLGCCMLDGPNGFCNTITEQQCCAYGGEFSADSECNPVTALCVSVGSGSGSAKLSTDNIAVEITPNPNNGTFTFKLDSPLEGVLGMRIFDITGRVVYEETSSYVFSGEYQKEIQLPTSLTDGVYTVKVTIGEGQINKRIVIQR